MNTPTANPLTHKPVTLKRRRFKFCWQTPAVVVARLWWWNRLSCGLLICVHFGLAVLAAGFSSNVSADDGLTISILQNASSGETATITLDEPLPIVLKNNSDHDIQIWNPRSRQGYYLLTLDSTNLETGETNSTSKRIISDDAYFATIAKSMEPGSNTVIIQAHDTFTVEIDVLDFALSELEWIDIPEPNTDAMFSIRARYHSASTNPPANQVWTGESVSKPLTAAIISKRLDTPHEYLRYKLPKLALRLMERDPGWISRTDQDQFTPLHTAARFKQLEVLKWLLDNGADVNAIAVNGVTPLHLTSDPDIVKLILEHKPDLSIRCRSLGQTPLQDAVVKMSEAHSDAERANWGSIVNLYLAAGAEYDVITAIHRDDLERVKAIMHDSPPVSDGFRRNNPLRCAASLGRLEICRCLIEEYHLDVNQFESGIGYPIIKDALAHPEVVDLLIKSGADLKRRITWGGGRSGIWIIQDDATALHYAADDGVPETIKLLIDANVDILARTKDAFEGTEAEQTALDVAAFFGKAENFEAMIKHPKFADVDKDVRQQLMNRCLLAGAPSSWLSRDANRPKLVKVLLENGADANAVAENGFTAIHAAAVGIHPDEDEENANQEKVIAILREYGGKLDLFSAVAIGDESAVNQILEQNPQSANARRYDGYPALQFAVDMDHKTIVEMLLKAGADVDIRNKSESMGSKNDTPLHCAAFWGRDEIAKILIEAGADVNAKSKDANTPLHDAAQFDNIRVSRLLLASGALDDAKDNNGKTPLDLARSDALKKLLRDHSGK